MEGRSDERAELAALRRRAYSADADIATDPAALARLTELEDLARLRRAAAADLHESGASEALPAGDSGCAAAGGRSRSRWSVLC